jgi:hypothetical protein
MNRFMTESKVIALLAHKMLHFSKIINATLALRTLIMTEPK